MPDMPGVEHWEHPTWTYEEQSRNIPGQGNTDRHRQKTTKKVRKKVRKESKKKTETESKCTERQRDKE